MESEVYRFKSNQVEFKFPHVWKRTAVKNGWMELVLEANTLLLTDEILQMMHLPPILRLNNGILTFSTHTSLHLQPRRCVRTMIISFH